MKYLAALLMLTSVALAERRDGPRLPSAMAVMVEENGRIVCSSPGSDMIEDLEAHLVSHQISDSQFSWQISYSQSENAGIQIQFRDVPTEVRDVIRHAAAIWEDHLVIDVPFTLRFHWENIQKESLAFISSNWSSGRNGSFSCLSQTFLLTSGYHCVPNSLANQITGRQAKGSNNTDPDFEIHIDKDRNWYLGTDRNPPSDKFELLGVVLHEIAHSVGFLSGASFRTSTNEAKLRGIGGSSIRILFYDFFIRAGFRPLSEGADYNCELYDELTDSLLLWGRKTPHGVRSGTLSKVYEVRGGPVPLWSSKFSPKSAALHLHGYIFTEYSGDDVITAAVGQGIAPQIGPATLAILYDLGWEIRNPPWEEEAEEETTTREPGDGGIRQRPVRRR